MPSKFAAKRITVLLADDHTLVRQGVRRLLEVQPDLVVVGEAQTGREAVELARTLCPEVVVMDVAMPLLNGLEATRQIRKAVPASKVLILSAHRDEAYVEQAIESGAAGYILKQVSADTLSQAIRAIQKGKTIFNPAIVKQLRERDSVDRAGRPRRKSARLSSREAEVLQLIAEGKANKEIATELGIVAKTVEKYRERLMRKLNIRGIAGLTRYAIRAGVVESGTQLTSI